MGRLQDRGTRASHLRLVHSVQVARTRTVEKLRRADLLTLEAYAEARAAFRERVIAHKKQRTLALGPHATLQFEDRLTVQYQVQEMLRIERIFEPQAIQDELDAYNPLVPDGSNLKATLLLEFPDPAQRRQALASLVGIERRVFARLDGQAPRLAIADEHLGPQAPGPTPAVHFLRFEFEPACLLALRGGAGLSFGIDDDRMRLEARAPVAMRQALLADFG